MVWCVCVCMCVCVCVRMPIHMCFCMSLFNKWSNFHHKYTRCWPPSIFWCKASDCNLTFLLGLPERVTFIFIYIEEQIKDGCNTLMKVKIHPMTSLVVQWLRLCASTALGTGLIPGLGTKISHATWGSHTYTKKSIPSLERSQYG